MKSPAMKTGRMDLLIRELSFSSLFWRLHVDEAAAGAFIHKLNHASDLGEESVVFAASYIDARLNAGAALAHDDGSAGNKLSAEGFYAQPLRIGVASVS